MSASSGAHSDYTNLPREKQTWSCPLCTTVNDTDCLNCISCYKGINPSHTKSLSNLMLHEQRKKIDESGLVERSLTRRFKSLLYTRKNDWDCPVCTVRMAGWRNTCTSCGTSLTSRSRSKSTGSIGILGSISSLLSGKKSSGATAESPAGLGGSESSLGEYVNIGMDSDGIPYDKIVRCDSDPELCLSFPPPGYNSNRNIPHHVDQAPPALTSRMVRHTIPAATERKPLISGFGLNHVDQQPERFVPYVCPTVCM